MNRKLKTIQNLNSKANLWQKRVETSKIHLILIVSATEALVSGYAASNRLVLDIGGTITVPTGGGRINPGYAGDFSAYVVNAGSNGRVVR